MPGLQDLSAIFNEGQYGLLNRGLQAQTTDQNSNDASLADQLQKTQQSAQMQPLKMATEQATANNLNATARQSQAMAATHEDALNVLKQVPMQSRIDKHMADSLKSKSEAEVAEIGAKMSGASVFAARALSNGGVLPMVDQQSLQTKYPELVPYFAKGLPGVQALSNMVVKYNDLLPKLQESRQAHQITANAQLATNQATNESHEKVANIQANGRLEAVRAKAATITDPLQLQTYYSNQAALAEEMDNKEEAAKFRRLAKNLDQQVLAKNAALAPKAGGLALPPSVPTVPAWTSQPGNQPQQKPGTGIKFMGFEESK
jgi:hypothetical protein